MGFPLRRVLHIHLAIGTLGEKTTAFSLGAADNRELETEGGGQDRDVQDEDGLERRWTVDPDGAETLTQSGASTCRLRFQLFSASSM